MDERGILREKYALMEIDDGKVRCPWVLLGDAAYVKYHDREWGVPVRDDVKQYEFLVLESAQAGLSWRTVLHKREAYRDAFCGFDYEKVSRFGEKEVSVLMNNAGIIRYRPKILAAIANAVALKEVREEWGSFSAYIWHFVDNTSVINARKSCQDYPSQTALSLRIAKDMKSRGFQFLGAVTIYSHLQATGIVQDHTVDCFRYKALS